MKLRNNTLNEIKLMCVVEHFRKDKNQGNRKKKEDELSRVGHNNLSSK